MGIPHSTKLLWYSIFVNSVIRHPFEKIFLMKILSGPQLRNGQSQNFYREIFVTKIKILVIFNVFKKLLTTRIFGAMQYYFAGVFINQQTGLICFLLYVSSIVVHLVCFRYNVSSFLRHIYSMYSSTYWYVP